jgi:LysM repeat protein
MDVMGSGQRSGRTAYDEEKKEDDGWFPDSIPGKKNPLSGIFGGGGAKTLSEQDKKLKDALKKKAVGYEVRRGDSIARIARRHGVHKRYIELLNPSATAKKLKRGDVLWVVNRTALYEAEVPKMDTGSVPMQEKYEPHSDAAKALFRLACQVAGLPLEWAEASGVHTLLKKESAGGYVGIPNYQYFPPKTNPASTKNKTKWPAIHDALKKGRIILQERFPSGKKSSATGLGQLILPNVDAYYPSGRHGIGQPLEEAIGMLRYIKEAYGAPAGAAKSHNKGREGY